MATIKIADPLQDYQSLKTEIDQALQYFLNAGSYILGNEVKCFEQEFAQYCDCQYGIGVSSGTAALTLTLRALGILPGDEVIIPSHTATATAAAVIDAGAIPVYADIAKNSTNICPRSVQKCLSKKTKAIIAVHLYGHPAPMNELNFIAKQNDAVLIEDASQAHGALFDGKKVGSLSDAACFSLYPTKNLGAFGDAGIITTNKAEIAEKLKLLREYGWKTRYISESLGTNSRLDEMQAAILRVKLKKLTDWTTLRRNNAQKLITGLKKIKSIKLPNVPENTNPVYHQFVIQSEERDVLIKKLKLQDIQTAIHYPVANHQQQGYVFDTSIRVSLKNTEKVLGQILSLPVHQYLQDKDLSIIIDALHSL